jgi:hypothetical protein
MPLASEPRGAMPRGFSLRSGNSPPSDHDALERPEERARDERGQSSFTASLELLSGVEEGYAGALFEAFLLVVVEGGHLKFKEEQQENPVVLRSQGQYQQHIVTR